MCKLIYTFANLRFSKIAAAVSSTPCLARDPRAPEVPLKKWGMPANDPERERRRWAADKSDTRNE